MRTLLLLLTLVAVLAGCSLLGGSDGGDAAPNGRSDDELVTLEAGQAATLTPLGLQIRFLGKTADSRCPTDVTCVWEGEATVRVELTPAGGEPVIVEMTGYVGPEGRVPGDDEGVFAEAAGFRVVLERLDPYPKDQNPDPGPVTAHLRVTRA